MPHHDHLDQNHQQNMLKLDERMIRALVTVFGMEKNGRIKKENARQVVEKLGLIYGSDQKENKAFQDDDEEEVVVEGHGGEVEEVGAGGVAGDVHEEALGFDVVVFGAWVGRELVRGCARDGAKDGRGRCRVVCVGSCGAMHVPTVDSFNCSRMWPWYWL